MDVGIENLYVINSRVNHSSFGATIYFPYIPTKNNDAVIETFEDYVVSVAGNNFMSCRFSVGISGTPKRKKLLSIFGSNLLSINGIKSFGSMSPGLFAPISRSRYLL